MDQALDVCAAVHGTHVVIHSPFTNWGYNHRGLYPPDTDRVLSVARDTLGAALNRASDMGVTFVLENIEDIELSDRAMLCEALDWQALELSVDTGHAHYAHVSTGAPPVDFYIRAAGSRLGHIHLQDADGFADRHWQIGHGTILWQSVFAAIAQTGANPRLILELRDKAGVLPSAAYLKAMGIAE
jgi:sugar phosphate isomerase/epimerase